MNTFRKIAILEGISYLLLFITMPLKYWLEMPTPNYIVGMLHGILFIIYIVFALVLARHKNWKWDFTLLVLLASLLPFATFYLERKYLRKMD